LSSNTTITASSTISATQGQLGVFGVCTDASTSAVGVTGIGSGTDSTGIVGEANLGIVAYGVWGKSTSGYAGFFTGKVRVMGMLEKAGGGFKIDHPLDPENRYLSHSFVESPDMLNVYSGIAETDDDGAATVVLPDYFTALNRDFTYQLTVLGRLTGAAVAAEIDNNEFTINTAEPNTRVSWLVTGVRQDSFAMENRILVDEPKSAAERDKHKQPGAGRAGGLTGAGRARAARRPARVARRRAPRRRSTPGCR